LDVELIIGGGGGGFIESGGILVEVPEADVIVAIPLRHDSDILSLGYRVWFRKAVPFKPRASLANK